jgi:hypothetical protein
MTAIMRHLPPLRPLLAALTLWASAGLAPAAAQGTAADYARARSLKATYEEAAGGRKLPPSTTPGWRRPSPPRPADRTRR